MSNHIKRWATTPWILVSACALCSVLAACASSRLIKNPALAASAPDLGWTVTAPEGLTVEVHQLILRNREGSWVRDANWDEYVLTISNGSQQAVEIQAIDLYSDRLTGPEASSISRERLDARSNTTLRTLKDVGVVAGAGVVLPTALIAAGTAGAAGSGIAAGAAAAAVGVVAIPVGIIGGTAYVIKRHHRTQQDNLLIEQNLQQRGFSVSAQILPGMQLESSAFFPITPAPTRLVIHYLADGESDELPLILPALSGLHMKTARAPPHPQQTSGG